METTKDTQEATKAMVKAGVGDLAVTVLMAF